MMFTAEEIKNAFLSLPRNKASGPDGYSSEFFNSCWTVVGGEVTDAVSEFFRSGTLLKQWNATTLVLIPKIPNAEHMSDFRPISCLNTVYKVGLERIGYPGNFKISGSGSLSGGSIILLSLSGSGIRGYPGVGYPSKYYNIRRISRSGFGSLK